MSFHAFPTQGRSSSTSRTSKQTKSSRSSPADTPPLPPTATFPAGPIAVRPVARSPKIGADDSVDLGSDGEGGPSRNGTLKKKRTTPASELISFFSENQPPPRTASPSAPGAPPARNASSSPTPYLRLSPSVGSKLSVKETSSADSSIAAPAEKPKEKKGFKGLMSKVLGKDSDHAAPSGGVDRRLISQPTAAPAGSVESMRAASFEQPSRDLQDHAATVLFPQQPVKQQQQQQQPAAASPAQDFARQRTKSALARGDQPPVAPFVRVRVTSQIDNGESYLPRDDPAPRARTVSQMSQSSASNTPTTGRPAPGVIPWLTGNDFAPQDRLKTPLRNMSISRKPVSPELRNAVDLPPEHAVPAAQTSPERAVSSTKTSPEQPPSTVSSPPRTHQAPLASRLAEVVARVASPPVDRAPLPTIYSPAQPQDSPVLAASPPRTMSMPDGPRPDVSPASTITMKDEMPTLTTFPVPPVDGGESPSRIQKSLASAAAHAAMAPPLAVFSAITPGASFDTPASPPTNGVEDKDSPVLAVPSSTASATEDDEPVTPKALREDTPKIRSLPFTASAPATQAIASRAAASAASAPSIPLADLVHLRSLLANASTADECRLLVNALLSLWKVPFPALPPSAPGSSLASDDTRAAEDRARESQIARVFTWLLSEASAASPAEPPSYQGTPTIAHPPTVAEPPRPVTPGTPRVIPPTPVHPSDGQFAPPAAAPSTTATVDEDGGSVHWAEELEEAEYEGRVVAGRAAMFKAMQRPNSPDGQHV